MGRARHRTSTSRPSARRRASAWRGRRRAAAVRPRAPRRSRPCPADAPPRRACRSTRRRGAPRSCAGSRTGTDRTPPARPPGSRRGRAARAARRSRAGAAKWSRIASVQFCGPASMLSLSSAAKRGAAVCARRRRRSPNRRRCVSRYARTRSPSSLSTSRPVASAGAGPFVWPVSDAPRRSTVQSPGGASQCSTPSRTWSVRSTTVAGSTEPEVDAAGRSARRSSRRRRRSRPWPRRDGRARPCAGRTPRPRRCRPCGAREAGARRPRPAGVRPPRSPPTARGGTSAR